MRSVYVGWEIWNISNVWAEEPVASGRRNFVNHERAAHPEGPSPDGPEPTTKYVCIPGPSGDGPLYVPRTFFL